MKSCLLCGQPLSARIRFLDLLCLEAYEPPVICSACQAFWQAFNPDRSHCPGCSRYLEAGSQATYCPECQDWLRRVPQDWLAHDSLLVYNPAIRQWLHRFKYQGDGVLGQLACPLLRAYYGRQPPCLWTVLPSSAPSLQVRKFHATGLLLDYAGIPYTCLLSYVGDGVPQASKDRKARLALSQPFQIQSDLEDLSGYSRLLIFDDVYTTGATLMAAKKVLAESFPYLELKSLSLVRDQDFKWHS